MSLILDQTIMNEVLTSLANSKLRIQITQFHYQHLNGYKSSNLIAGSTGVADSAEGSGAPGNTGFRPPIAGPGGPGGFRPPPGSGPGGSEMGGMRPPASGGTGVFRPGVSGSGATDVIGDINIVELNLYGVASLFEKPGVPPVASDNAPPGSETSSPRAPAVPVREDK